MVSTMVPGMATVALKPPSAVRSCPVCGTAFSPSGRRAYCSGACRQAAWRRRHVPAPPRVPVPPKGAKRAVTVYQCDLCGARALGEQYCSECCTFMRAVGRGGLCPEC
jgi:predicted nucleic acid-binding Zn ribbon protein